MHQTARASPVSDSYNRQILYAATPKATLQCAQLRHLNVASLAFDSVLQCSNCLSFPNIQLLKHVVEKDRVLHHRVSVTNHEKLVLPVRGQLSQTGCHSNALSKLSTLLRDEELAIELYNWRDGCSLCTYALQPD